MGIHGKLRNLTNANERRRWREDEDECWGDVLVKVESSEDGSMIGGRKFKIISDDCIYIVA